MRHFLTLLDVTAEEFVHIIDLADAMKRDPDRFRDALAHKSVALMFASPSTRTRVSFDVGVAQLGGHPLTLDMASGLQTSRGETLEDTARTLSRYVDAIVIRTPRQSDIETLARAGSVPVVNALSRHHHPCQALADIMTIREHVGRLRDVRVAWFGVGDNNVCHSLMLAAPRMGVSLSICCPPGLGPDNNVLSEAAGLAASYETTLEVLHEPAQVKHADVVYTDTWISMGDEAHADRLLRQLEPYRVTPELMKRVGNPAIFMHCLPAHRGDEMTAEVIDGARSVVFDQAENRLHTEKALLHWLLCP